MKRSTTLLASAALAAAAAVGIGYAALSSSKPAADGAAAAPAADTASRWRTSLAAATRKAAEAGKDVLIEFTVRDGDAPAGPSLDQRVYNDPRFLDAVSARFVPVRLTVNTEAAAAGGGGDAGIVALAERLGVARTPSLVLTDAAGQPYAAVELGDESVDAQLAAVGAAAGRRATRDASIALAERSAGAERARHLDAALGQVGRFAQSHYQSTMEQVVALDPTNELGLREKYHAPASARRIDELVQTTVYPLIDQADLAGAAEQIDQILTQERPPHEHAQTLLAFKAQLFYSLGRKDDARQLFDQSLAMAPHSASANQIRAAMSRMAE